MDKPIFWHQGLFLQPQHLQLSTRYSESVNLPLKTYLQPHFWGGGQLAGPIDRAEQPEFSPDRGQIPVPGHGLCGPLATMPS